MNILSILVVTALTLVAAYLAVRMTVAILGNFHDGRQFRRALIERAQRLRMMRMLERRGIDAQAYLHQDSVVNIEKQLRACEMCETTRTCDTTIASRKGESDFGFCANDSSFERYQKRVVPIAEVKSSGS
jgi:hypothetical protein